MSQVSKCSGIELRPSQRARMMLLRAFLAQNTAVGCAFAGFGISLLPLQERFGTSRGLASLAMALVVLGMSGLGPLMAAMVARIGLRATMSVGVALSAIGYAVLAFAPTMAVVLWACGLLIGPGAALFGSIPPSILAGGWYPKARGRAVGIAYIPLFFTLIPLPGLAILQHFGLPALFLSLAALHALLFPLMLGITDPPVTEAGARQGETPVSMQHPIRSLVARPIFWAIILGDGILNAAAITGSSHIVPIAIEYGSSHEAAALLLSVMGGASIVGSIISGVLCDRIGAARTLSLAGLGFAVSWAIIACTGWLPALLLAMLIMGSCSAAVFPPINVVVAQVFGEVTLARAMGLIGVFMLPIVFGMPPAAGWLRDVSGTYKSVMTTFIVVSAFVALKFFLMSRALARFPSTPESAVA